MGVVARLTTPTRATTVGTWPRNPNLNGLLTVITPPNNSMQPTALRAAADAERWAYGGSFSGVPAWRRIAEKREA